MEAIPILVAITFLLFFPSFVTIDFLFLSHSLFSTLRQKVYLHVVIASWIRNSAWYPIRYLYRKYFHLDIHLSSFDFAKSCYLYFALFFFSETQEPSCGQMGTLMQRIFRSCSRSNFTKNEKKNDSWKLWQTNRPTYALTHHQDNHVNFLIWFVFYLVMREAITAEATSLCAGNPLGDTPVNLKKSKFTDNVRRCKLEFREHSYGTTVKKKRTARLGASDTLSEMDQWNLEKERRKKKFKPPNHCAEHPLGDAPVNLTENKINKKTVSHWDTKGQPAK